MQEQKIAVSHATSVRGEAVLERFQSSQISAEQLVVLDTESKRGTRLPYGSSYLITEDQADFDFANCSLLLLLEGDDEVESQARSVGCFVLGCSGDPDQPLAYMGSVFEEAEIGYGSDGARLPRPETSCVLDSLLAIQRVEAIRQIQITWLQSASHYGKAGIDELASQTINLLNTREIKPVAFPQQIAFNLITAAVDPLIAEEIAGFLSLSAIQVNQNVIVAPVFYGLAAAVTIDFDAAVDIDEVSSALNQLDGVSVSHGESSLVSECNQSFSCAISQIHTPLDDSLSVGFWLMADPDRYGLARNYVSLSEFLQNSFL